MPTPVGPTRIEFNWALLNPGMKWMLYARNFVSIHTAFQQRLQLLL
ncbi:MAG: hypothetical protein K6T90_19195 [Leptolyngbyaceae cyanobacterium HOT.MB2.61]|nr:hypothetical protein [Leptolyngbyaceae cyanobacterium HOT.MB2.61]